MSRTLALCVSHSPGMNMPGEESNGSDFRRGIASAAQSVEEFDPDLVVMFGTDHRRTFREIIPTFLTAWDATGFGDYGSPTGAFDVPADDVRRLTAALVVDGFDLAVGTGLALDHGFCQTAEQVLGSLDARPVIPVFVNCATAPLPTVARTIDLAMSIGRFFTDDDRRILYLASGGLSHTPPTLDADSRLITDEQRMELLRANREVSSTLVYSDWDTTVLNAFAGSRDDVLATVTDEFLEAGGTGAHEVRNWIASWAAAGCAPLDTIAYEPVPAWFTGMGIAATRRSHPAAEETS